MILMFCFGFGGYFCFVLFRNHSLLQLNQNEGREIDDEDDDKIQKYAHTLFRNSTTFKRNRVTYLGMFRAPITAKRNKMVPIHTVTRHEQTQRQKEI